MIELSNLRLEENGEWTKLVCDISGLKEHDPRFTEETMWFAVKTENAHMFTTKVYDAFLLVPLYLGMYLGQDVKIHGNVSKKLYRNLITYIQKILLNFSDDLKRVNLIVDGFDIVEDDEKFIIGTGISCGVDSMSTIYDHFEKEHDLDYKINTLFFFNTGTHGNYENSNTEKIYLERYMLNKLTADELGLPVYMVNTNLHAFTHKIAEQKVGYFAIHSCIISLQKVIKRYYMSSTYSYNGIMKFGEQSHDFDLAEFADSYLLPLIQTEKFELIYDGGQYTRTQKTCNIANWDIAKRHINVCISPLENAKNCSKCTKCMRTLIPLDSMGKVEQFGEVFNLDVYRKNKFYNLCLFRKKYGKDGFATDIIDFAREHGEKIPSLWVAKLVCLKEHSIIIKHFMRKCLGNARYELLKQRLKGEK